VVPNRVSLAGKYDVTCISVVAAAVGLLLGADERKGSDSKQDVEFQAPADSGFILVVWKRQTDAWPDRSEAKKNELERVKGTWVQAGESVPPQEREGTAHLYGPGVRGTAWRAGSLPGERQA
jgi:hypothetical protein